MILYYSMGIPFGVEYMVGLGIGILLLISSNHFNIVINRAFLWIFLFVVSYFSLESFLNYGLVRSFSYGFTIIIMYLCGYNWFKFLPTRESKNDCTMFAIKLVYIGISAYIIICVVYTFLTGNTLNAFNRDPIVFWNGTEGNSTHFSSMSAVPMAISAYLSITDEGKNRIFNIGIFFSVLLCNLLMANRIAVVFAVMFILLSLYLKYKDSGFDKKTKVFMSILIFFIIIWGAYTLNLFNIQSRIMQLPMVKRTLILNQQGYEDPRLERQLYVLKNFTKHMNGGGHYNAEVGEVHNVWLDVYDYAGIIPFLIFIILTVSILIEIFKSFKKNKYDKTISVFIMLLVAFFMSFAEEPVFRSCESYTVLFFFCCGLFYRFMEKSK